VECIDELLLDSVSNLTSLAREKNLAWSIRCDESIGVLCDSHAVQRALTNVLENAIKYTRHGSIIDIQIVREKEWVRLTVTDQGEGIPPEDLPRIFDRFYRRDRNRSTRGSGLGLSIIKSVVESHNGEVKVESTVGIGTTVTMVFPAAGEPAHRQNICV
jgi:signal transduction histidine kinase